jgi:hypothetical protein
VWAAAAVVVASGIATAAATVADDGAAGFVTRVVIALLGWVGWIVGARVLNRVALGARAGLSGAAFAYVLGVAHVPFLLRPLGLLTTADALIALILLAWMVAAAAIGINQLLAGQPLFKRALVTVGGTTGYLSMTALAGIIFLG